MLTGGFVGDWIATFVVIGMGGGFIQEDAGVALICVTIASGDRLGSGNRAGDGTGAGDGFD